MEYNVWHIDEYSEDSRQGNEFAPAWPFRMAVSGSSDSGKTTMLMNLLMGNKETKEDGERYVLCNDLILIAKHPNEPKWQIVRNIYNALALDEEEGEDVSFQVISPEDIPDVDSFNPERYTVVVFEDLMNAPKKIQEKIADYFSSGRHSNVSPIYVSQRFFAIPKTIRENVNYISLHRGAGSLSDIKRIFRQYTEHSDILAPAIDDLTLKKEFIVFDLRRSRDDPLSIRVRWDTSLRSILDASGCSQSSILDQSQIDPRSVNVASMTKPGGSYYGPGLSLFSSYGQKAVAEAKRSSSLVEFAKNYPSPKERKVLLASGTTAKNKDIWIRYVFREAYGISGKDLGPEWVNFSKQVKDNKGNKEPAYSKKFCLNRYEEILKVRPIDDKKYIEAHNVLLWLLSNGHINRKTFYSATMAL